MARIVLGLGTSHTPMTSAPSELWADHGRIFDKRQKELLGKDGNIYDYPGILERAQPGTAEQADPALHAERFGRCQKAIERLADSFEKAAPDLAIIIGEDQHEHFIDEFMPAMLVYWGNTIPVGPPQPPPNPPPTLTAAAWAYGEHEGEYPVAADLGKHIIEYLIGSEFDIAHSRKLPKPRGVGHAYAFVYQRIMRGKVVPHVPVFLNTYYPPNVPSAKRCYDFGRTIRRAIEDWAPDLTVAVIASGGLSHFVVNEELDRQVLRAMEEHDAAALRTLPRNHLRSGTSEILNWITAAATLDGLQMEVLDYVPAYRSEAGTGIGMAFAEWR